MLQCINFHAFAPSAVNYKDDWIVDFRCSNHMTGDTGKLLDMMKYTRSRVVVTTDNSKLPITHIGNTVVVPQFNSHQVQLQNVYHVQKNLLSVS